MWSSVAGLSSGVLNRMSPVVRNTSNYISLMTCYMTIYYTLMKKLAGSEGSLEISITYPKILKTSYQVVKRTSKDLQRS